MRYLGVAMSCWTSYGPIEIIMCLRVQVSSEGNCAGAWCDLVHLCMNGYGAITWSVTVNVCSHMLHAGSELTHTCRALVHDQAHRVPCEGPSVLRIYCPNSSERRSLSCRRTGRVEGKLCFLYLSTKCRWVVSSTLRLIYQLFFFHSESYSQVWILVEWHSCRVPKRLISSLKYRIPGPTKWFSISRTDRLNYHNVILWSSGLSSVQNGRWPPTSRENIFFHRLPWRWKHEILPKRWSPPTGLYLHGVIT
jgi:hypothetical protein